jgi:hypothetical protein
MSLKIVCTIVTVPLNFTSDMDLNFQEMEDKAQPALEDLALRQW